MEDETEARSTIGGLVVAIVVTLGAAVYGFGDQIKTVAPLMKADDYAGVLGTVFGDALFMGTLVWAVLYFAFVRSRASRLGPAYWAILCAVYLVANIGLLAFVKTIADSDDAQMHVAAGEIAKAFSAAQNPTGCAIDMRIAATGDAGEMERVTKATLTKFCKAKVDFAARTSTLGVSTMMAPSHFATTSGVADTRAKLVQVREAIRALRTEITDLIAGYRKEIQTSRLGDRNKAAMLAGLDKAMTSDLARVNALLDYEDSEYVEFQAMTGILAHPKGRWEVRGNKLLFANAADLSAYQAHLNAARNDALQAQTLAATTRADVQNSTLQLQQQ